MVRSQKFQHQPEGAQRNEQAPGDQRLRSTYPAYMEENPWLLRAPFEYLCCFESRFWLQNRNI